MEKLENKELDELIDFATNAVQIKYDSVMENIIKDLEKCVMENYSKEYDYDLRIYIDNFLEKRKDLQDDGCNNICFKKINRLEEFLSSLYDNIFERFGQLEKEYDEIFCDIKKMNK